MLDFYCSMKFPTCFLSSQCVPEYVPNRYSMGNHDQRGDSSLGKNVVEQPTVRASLVVLSMSPRKLFFTFKFSYLLFINPTHKT